MNFISQYKSDDEQEEPEEINKKLNTENETLNENNPHIVKIDSAPNIDIQDLVYYKEIQKAKKFNEGYYISDKNNHLTGNLNTHTIDDFNFNEQYYTYNAYGYAQNPTDFILMC